MAEKAEVILAARDTTGPAFAAAQKHFRDLKAIAVGVAAGFTAFQVAIQPALKVLEHFNPKGVIDAADGLNKLSQKTGIAVETLSGYQHAAKLADVSNEELNIGLKKLSLNIAAAARGEEDQAAAFRAIGISQKFLRDNVNNTDKVFEEVAARFEGYNDGANKNAIANALFGKSFESLIPLLNGGRKGLAEARNELERYGGVITADLAAKSEQFNDNLTRLATASGALKVEIASGLIDALVRLSERMVEASKSGGILKAALLELANVPTTVVGLVDLLVPAPDKVASLKTRAEEIESTIEKLRKKLEEQPGNWPLFEHLKQLEAKLATVQAKLRAAQEDERGSKIGVPANTGEFTRTDHDRTPVKAKPNAPPLPGSGDASKAEALLKKQLDGRLKALQVGLERERDLFQFSEQRLAELFQHGDLSIDEFYEQKAKAQLEYLAKQQEGFTAEIAALRAHQAKTKDATSRADDENKINEAIAAQAKVFREAGQAAETAGVQQSRAATEFAQSLREVDAQLAELAGDKFGAELLRNAQRLDDARKTLSGKTGGDPARLQALQNALDLQARANKEQESSQRLAESAANAEELFNIRAARAGLSREETERGLLALHEQQLTLLDAQIARYGELVQRSAELNKGVADPALLSFYENLKLARERAFDAKDPALVRFNELAAEGARDIASAFEDAVIEGGKLSDIVRNLSKQLSRLLLNELTTKPLEGQIRNWLKGLTGSSDKGGTGTSPTDAGGGGIVAKLLGFSSSAKPGTPANVPLTTGDFTRTDHDTTPVGLPVPAAASPAEAAQVAAMEQATSALQALTEAANAASGALGKPPGTVAPSPAGSQLPGAAAPSPEATAEADAADANTDSADASAKSLDNLGQTAQSGAATFDSAISTLAASALRGTAALGGLPGAFGVFANFLQRLLSSSGSGSGINFGSLFGSSSRGAGAGTGLEGMSSEELSYFFHRGGVVGSINDVRPVPAGIFASARRLHEGGAVGGDGAAPAPAPVTGLAPNEVPAILMGGPKGTREEVLRADDPRHQDNLHGVAFQRFLTQIVDSSPIATRAFHTGGLVGHGGRAVALPASIWHGADRYHDGGVVGVASMAMQHADPTAGAVPAWRDEKQRAGSASQTIVVHVTPQPNQSRDTSLQTGRLIGAGIQAALKRNG